MKKKVLACNHQNILLRRCFTNLYGEWYYYEMNRCKKCRMVTEEKFKVTIKQINENQHIPILLNVIRAEEVIENVVD